VNHAEQVQGDAYLAVLGEVPFEKGPQPQTGLPTGNRHDVPSKTYLKTAGRESSRAVASLSYRSVPGTAELWLIALRGLPWGEAALDTVVAMIEQQRVANGRLVTIGPPKTAASRRQIALDRHTVRLLPEHQRRQGAAH
jgi:hypothetical protein